ncbi:MAG TPA: hypothetical protein VGW39_10775 [Chthoniobacterales bacterium]|nr:hypothetical protein [Chthoniobacterales bacterium]
MSRFRPNRFARCLPGVLVAVLAFAASVPSASARGRQDPAFATSADDPALRKRLAALSPTVRPEEVQLVARCAYNTGRELKREWRVAWPPGLHNFLVNSGARKGGLCFQFATELLLRLDALKLETLELHWAESFERTASEHNVIVVTARGQPFHQGILLDNWRYGGRLVWGPVTGDPHYQWKENKAEAARRLTGNFRYARDTAPPPPIKTR